MPKRQSSLSLCAIPLTGPPQGWQPSPAFVKASTVAVNMQSTAVWNLTSCSMVEIYLGTAFTFKDLNNKLQYEVTVFGLGGGGMLQGGHAEFSGKMAGS
jgi:hypothetical protein